MKYAIRFDYVYWQFIIETDRKMTEICILSIMFPDKPLVSVALS